MEAIQKSNEQCQQNFTSCEAKLQAQQIQFNEIEQNVIASNKNENVHAEIQSQKQLLQNLEVDVGELKRKLSNLNHTSTNQIQDIGINQRKESFQSMNDPRLQHSLPHSNREEKKSYYSK